jgi:hypothetical protein
MYPWKLWQTTSDKTGGGQPAIRFFQPDMKASELMGVYQTFAKQADEVTGVPNYIYGSGQASGAGRTASGLSMLMDNAAKGIKLAITRIDHVVTMVVDRYYVHNMLYSMDNFIKGDMKVVSKGALGLIAKEAIQQRRNEFLQAVTNPVDVSIIGPEGRSYLLREMAEGLQMDTDKIIPAPEMIKFKAEQAAVQQAQQQALGMAGDPAAQGAMPPLAGAGMAPPAQPAM